MCCRLFIVLIYKLLLLLSTIESTCLKNVTCVSLPTCAPFMKVITNARKPLKIDLVKYLRSQECDFELGYPKVCCSNTIFHQNVLDDGNPVKLPPNSDKPNGNTEVTLPSTPEAEAIRQKKIEQMNKVLIESGIMDFIGFDLFRRRKSEYLLYMVDVEIR